MHYQLWISSNLIRKKFFYRYFIPMYDFGTIKNFLNQRFTNAQKRFLAKRLHEYQHDGFNVSICNHRSI